MSAADSLSRIVSLVAELTRRAREGASAPTLAQLAGMHDVLPAQIQNDLRTLTLLGDDADSEWLLSLSVWQQGDQVSVSSQGPFRRPLRLTSEELLAVQVGLVSDGEVDLARRMASLTRLVGEAPPPTGADNTANTLGYSLLRQLSEAVAHRQRVHLFYAGEGEREGKWWSLQPHQLVEYRNRHYLVCWCEDVGEWRHFRTDRVLDLRIDPDRFEFRTDFVPASRPGDVFRGEAAETVTVRFGSTVARWIRERYPAAEPQADGSVHVTFKVANPDWLVRKVLEYGPDAEVIAPVHWRDAVRAAVA